MERALYRLVILILVSFLILTIGLGYWCLLRGPELTARADNPRHIEAERHIQRGNILDRYGRPLALSLPTEDNAWERTYPLPAAAPVVGYLSYKHGKGGIEESLDPYLTGATTLSPEEEHLATWLHLPRRGLTVTLTIDADLQEAASQALSTHRGAAVAIIPQTGEILALASAPTFNPNTLDDDWPTLQSDPDHPMLNRATQGLYSPGAIFQTVVLAAAIEENLVDLQIVVHDPTGIFAKVDPPIYCDRHPGRESFPLRDAFALSCNVAFAQLGLDLGSARLAADAARLGLGITPTLPIPASGGQIFRTMPPTRSTLAHSAIGQGDLLVTPLQMGLVIATLANNGTVPSLRMVLSPTLSTSPAQAVLSPHTVTAMHQALTYAAAQQEITTPELPIAGIAGTAEAGAPGAPPHAWFIGFAPADAPQIAVAVLVEHTPNPQAAIEIGRAIIRAYTPSP